MGFAKVETGIGENEVMAEDVTSFFGFTKEKCRFCKTVMKAVRYVEKETRVGKDGIKHTITHNYRYELSLGHAWVDVCPNCGNREEYYSSDY